MYSLCFFLQVPQVPYTLVGTRKWNRATVEWATCRLSTYLMVVRKMKTLDFCWAGLIQIDEFAVTIKSGHLQMKKYKQARPSFDFFFF